MTTAWFLFVTFLGGPSGLVANEYTAPTGTAFMAKEDCDRSALTNTKAGQMELFCVEMPLLPGDG